MSSNLATDDHALIHDLIRESYNNPAFFMRALLRVDHLRSWQQRVCDRIQKALENGEKHPRVLIRTCHTAGKTFFSAAILLWWMVTRHNSRGMTTAQTWDQIETALWPEIGTLFENSLMYEVGFGRLLNTELHFAGSTPERPKTWFAKGSSSDRPARMEGQHSPTAVIRIIDEAKEVDDAVFTATAGFLAAPRSMDLWISTPSIQVGKFFERDTSAKDVIREHVDIEELIHDPLCTEDERDLFVKWKQEHLEEWGGEDSPEYQSRALANYIDNAEGALFPVSWLERAMAQTWDCNGPVVAGMDVAGSTDGDQNAVALCQGPDPSTEKLRVLSVEGWHQQDTMASKGKALSIARPHGARLVIDEIGIGKGVGDSARADGHKATGYRSSDRARDPERFSNRKAEDAWGFREKIEKGALRLPKDQKFLAQARAMKYRITQAGKIQVVDPDDSPDLVDAVLISVASAGRGEFRSATVDTTLGDTARAWKESAM